MMFKRNEMIAVLQNLDKYEAVAILNAFGDPSAGLLKRLDCSDPQVFEAIDQEGGVIPTPLEVIYDPFTDENILIWRPDPDTPALEGIRLTTVETHPIVPLVAEVAFYVFGLERIDAEEDMVVAELVATATGGKADEQE